MIKAFTNRLGQLFNSPSLNGIDPSGESKAGTQIETKSAVPIDFAGPTGSWVYFNGHNGSAEQFSRDTAFAAAAYIYAAMRFRAQNIAEPPLVVVRDTRDGPEPEPDHEVSQLLANPSADYDAGETVELTQYYLDLHGQALWAKDLNLAGSMARLTPFGGHEFTVRSTADRIFGRFHLRTKRGETIREAEQVVFFRYLNPGARLTSVSPTDVALSWMNVGGHVQATVKNLLSNAIFPSIVIQADKEWSPSEEDFNRWKAHLEAYHSGPANAGKPLALLGGGTATRVAFSLKDLLPDEILDRIEANVALAFGVPPVVLGMLVGLRNSPWSQMSEAKTGAYEETIEPLWRRHEKAITRQLLRPVDPDPDLRVAFDTSMVRALQDDESRKVEDALKARWWTVDERRLWTGQEPIGGDRGAFIEAIDGLPDLSATNPADDAKRARPRIEVKQSERDAAWSRFDLMAKAQESSWETGVYRQLKRDRDALLELIDELKATGPDELKAPPPEADPEHIAAVIAALAERLGLEEDWLEVAEPLVESTGRTALRDLTTQLGVSFDLVDRHLLDYVRREAAYLVRQIPATTRDRIAAELRAALAEGETIPQIRDRIRDTWAFSRERATLIARTEVTRVTNGSQRESLAAFAVEEEVGVEKSWLSSRDALVRPEHQALDDESWIPIDTAFANGLQGPGEPNCRCTTLYRIVEETP